MCPLLKAFETRGAREQTTKVRRRAFSLLTIMSRAQRQRARTEMWQSNYGTETRGRPRVRRVRGYRCVVLVVDFSASRTREPPVYGITVLLDLVILNTQAFSFLRAGCGGIRTACAATSQLARTHACERFCTLGRSLQSIDANSEVATSAVHAVRSATRVHIRLVCAPSLMGWSPHALQFPIGSLGRF